MEIRVDEGRLVEVPTPGATGMDRRAFGEFESARGELASYAFGWSTDPEATEGRLTIGIGVGNPGGATFHAGVRADADGYAFALLDEPFEDVPEGGPDLTADEARAHDTLPFIWHVADCVLANDRRANWMLPPAGRDARDPDAGRCSSARSRSCSSSTTTMTSCGS